MLTLLARLLRARRLAAVAVLAAALGAGGCFQDMDPSPDHPDASASGDAGSGADAPQQDANPGQPDASGPSPDAGADGGVDGGMDGGTDGGPDGSVAM